MRRSVMFGLVMLLALAGSLWVSGASSPLQIRREYASGRIE